MHGETFNSLIVLDNWVESLLLEFLPVTTQFILIIGVEHQQKVLDAGHNFLQLEIALGDKKMVSLLFKLSDRVECGLQGLCNLLVIFDQLGIFPRIIFVHDMTGEDATLDGEDLLIADNQRPEDRLKDVPLLLSEFCELDELFEGNSFLGESQVQQGLSQFPFKNRGLGIHLQNCVIELTDFGHFLQLP